MHHRQLEPAGVLPEAFHLEVREIHLNLFPSSHSYENRWQSSAHLTARRKAINEHRMARSQQVSRVCWVSHSLEEAQNIIEFYRGAAPFSVAFLFSFPSPHIQYLPHVSNVCHNINMQKEIRFGQHVLNWIKRILSEVCLENIYTIYYKYLKWWYLWRLDLKSRV